MCALICKIIVPMRKVTPMTGEEMKKNLFAVLQAIQADSGHEPPPLSDKTVPLAELKDFDSMACVDVEVRLTDLLGVAIEKIPFKSPETGHEQTIAQIVAHLTAVYGNLVRNKVAPSGPEATR